jgi:hypothetical protein
LMNRGGSPHVTQTYSTAGTSPWVTTVVIRIP